MRCVRRKVIAGPLYQMRAAVSAVSRPNAPASRAKVRGAVVGDEAVQDWEDSGASAERIYAYCALTASGCDRGDASRVNSHGGHPGGSLPLSSKHGGFIYMRTTQRDRSQLTITHQRNCPPCRSNA